MVDSIDGFAVHLLKEFDVQKLISPTKEGGMLATKITKKKKLDVRRAEFEPFGEFHEGGAGRHRWDGHCD